MPVKGFTSVFICLVLSACSADKNVSRSFYYWEKDFYLSEDDRTLLERLGNERIYLRCFTMEWDKPTRTLRNTDEVKFEAGSLPPALEIVPVVHIKPDFFQFIKSEQIPLLATALLKRVDSLAKHAEFSFSELQVDFRWNEQSRELYFALLGSLKAALDPVQQKLSCSIRLQQLQFPDVTGVPPVDRGMLLYYNTGKLNEPGTRNSIYDPDVAARYVSYVKNYQLPLDIALPVFTWGVHQRNGEVLSVIQNITLSDAQNSGFFTEKAKGLFASIQTCYFKGTWFKEGDRLRVEEISPLNSLRAARQVQPFLSDAVVNVALFCLDSANTSRYRREDFDDLYSVFE
jgi:hypothetical protein